MNRRKFFSALAVMPLALVIPSKRKAVKVSDLKATIKMEIDPESIRTIDEMRAFLKAFNGMYGPSGRLASHLAQS